MTWHYFESLSVFWRLKSRPETQICQGQSPVLWALMRDWPVCGVCNYAERGELCQTSTDTALKSDFSDDILGLIKTCGH